MQKTIYQKFTATAFHNNNLFASAIWAMFLFLFWNDSYLGIGAELSKEIFRICTLPVMFMLAMQLVQIRDPLWAQKHVIKIANCITWVNAIVIAEVAAKLATGTSLESTSAILVIFLIFQSILNPLTHWSYSAFNGLFAIIYYLWSLSGAGASMQRLQFDFSVCMTIHILLIHALRIYQSVSIKEDEVISQLEAEKRVSIAARYEAIEAKRAREDFIANISHEIRTPLFGIIGLTTKILSSSNDWSTINVAEKIGKSTKHLLSIVNDILDFSEQNKKGIKVYQDTIDINTLIEDVSKIIESQIRDVNVQYFIQVETSAPKEIQSDAKLITQILVNLLGNAAKYTKNGEITFRTRSIYNEVGQTFIEFAVVDTGVGISAESLERLFRPFEQGDQSFSKEYSGTGLGLVLTKSFVQALKGEIYVRSEYQKGSTFTVKIPYPVNLNVESFYPSRRHDVSRCFYLFTANTSLAKFLAEVVLDVWQKELRVESRKYLPYLDLPSNSIVIIDGSLHELSDENELHTLIDLERSKTIRFIYLSSFKQNHPKSSLDFVLQRSIPAPIYPRLFVDCVEGIARDFAIKTEEIHNQNDSSINLRLGARVLLADDNELNLDILSDNLLSFGLAVDFALDGNTALHLAKESLSSEVGYSCFFIDMQMPGKDGIAVIKEVRTCSRYSKTPIFIVTANALDSSARACIEAGATGVLVKPFHSHSLKKLIHANISPLESNMTRLSAAHQVFIDSVKTVLELRSNYDIDVFSGILRSNGKIYLYSKAIPRLIQAINKIRVQIEQNLKTSNTKDLTFLYHSLENSLSILGANRLISILRQLRDLVSNNPGAKEIYELSGVLCTDLLSLELFLEKIILDLAKS